MVMSVGYRHGELCMYVRNSGRVKLQYTELSFWYNCYQKHLQKVARIENYIILLVKFTKCLSAEILCYNYINCDSATGEDEDI